MFFVVCEISMFLHWNIIFCPIATLFIVRRIITLFIVCHIMMLFIVCHIMMLFLFVTLGIILKLMPIATMVHHGNHFDYG